MEFYFSPYTEEHIPTDDPADWMGRTELPVPEYNRRTHSAYFREGAWELVAHPPLKPVVPSQVSRAQGKVVLIQMGLWQQVLAYVAAIPDDTQRALAEVAINDTKDWYRSSPFLNQAADALGITQEQMDALFTQASQVQL